MGVILDSSVLIASERIGESVRLMLERFRTDTRDDVYALSAITVVELTHGIFRAKNPASSIGGGLSAKSCIRTQQYFQFHCQSLN